MAKKKGRRRNNHCEVRQRLLATTKSDRWADSWPWAFCVVAGAWLSISKFQAVHNADSLLISIVSLVKWTPFCWQMNRYGMLWPLLCSWIHHPLHNVVAVMFCNVSAGLAAHFLLARLMWRERGPWQWTGLLSIVVTFLLGSSRFIFETISPVQFTTTPLALGCVALGWLAVEKVGKRRLFGAATSFTVISWYNPAAALMLGVTLFWSTALTWTDRPNLRSQRWSMFCVLSKTDLLRFGMTACSILLAMTLMRRSIWHDPAFDENLSLRDWLESASVMASKLFWRGGAGEGSPALATGVCVGALSVAAITLWSGDRAAWQGFRRMLGGLLGVSTYALLVSQRAWTKHEGHGVRYFYPVLFVGCVAVCVGVVALIHGHVLKRRGVCLAAAEHSDVYALLAPPQPSRHGRSGMVTLCALACLAACILCRFGPPSYAGVEQHFTRWTGEVGEELLANEATHIAGSYWQAWPGMFYANWQRYLQKDPRRVFAVANRYQITVPLMPPQTQSWRIGVLKSSRDEALAYLAGLGFQEAELISETRHLLLVRPVVRAQ